MRLLVVLLLAVALAWPALVQAGADGPAAASQDRALQHSVARAGLPVVVVPGLDLADLERLSSRGAVGLLVPGAGPETSGDLARAAVERAEARNSLRGGLPEGPRLIRVRTSSTVPAGPAIVLGLPEGGRQPNDRRYPIAVLAPGYEGLLTSPSTRIAGLVSAVDVAPTALGREVRLSSTPSGDPVSELRDLDARIRDNGDARQPASFLAAALVVLLAVVRPRAAVLGVAAALAANLVLGVAGVSDPWVTVPVIAASVLAAAPAARLSTGAIGVACAAVLVAYLVAMGVDDRWVALSPLGPSQNARFYGISNLLETMLLVPALAAAALLSRRLGGWRGASAFGAVAMVSLVAIAGSRFGADGGGAIVFATGFAVLGALLAGGGRRPVALALAGGAAVVLLLALDAVIGPTTHVGETVRGGPGELTGDLADRISLSWKRATTSVASGLTVAAGIAALVVLVVRLRGMPRALAALPIAFAAAIAVSLIVNDSPLDVVVWGVAGLLALGALEGLVGRSTPDRGGAPSPGS